MPRSSPSGITGLIKLHDRPCRAKRPGLTRPQTCGCPWYGDYRGYVVQLARWAHATVNPKTLDPARAIFTRMKAAIDNNTFDKEGERTTATSGETFRDYIDQWWIEHVVEHGLSTDSLKPMCEVLKRSVLGRTALHDLTTKQISDWLSQRRKEQSWGKKTYNEYLALIKKRLLDRAVILGQLKHNPATAILPLKGVVDQRGELRHWRITPEIEARLFAACATLNRTYGSPNPQMKLTQAKADAIRARVAAGTTQRALAHEYAVSETVVSQIMRGTIWNAASRVTTTKGNEMERRLIGALDMGPRAGEMEAAQLSHVDWDHPRPLKDKKTGKAFHGYTIVLPPDLTKGGKRTGETQYLYAATLRASRMLEARRAQLADNPAGYIFGSDTGYQIKSFDKSWQALFAAAGLDWGRGKGITWHRTRHEFVSRLVKKYGLAMAKKMARHANQSTTERYNHPTDDDVWDAAQSLD